MVSLTLHVEGRKGIRSSNREGDTLPLPLWVAAPLHEMGQRQDGT